MLQTKPKGDPLIKKNIAKRFTYSKKEKNHLERHLTPFQSKFVRNISFTSTYKSFKKEQQQQKIIQL